MYTHITVIEAAPGRSDELGGYLRDLLEPVRQLEGCVGFELLQDYQCWKLRGNWRSATALEGYFQAPLLQEVLNSAWRNGVVRNLKSRAA